MKRKLTITTNIVVIVFSMASVLVFTWFSSYAGELYTQIPITLLVVSVLIALFFKKVRDGIEIDKFKNTLPWLLLPAAFLVATLSNLYLDRLVSLIPAWLGLNIGFLIMLAPVAFIYWLIAGKRRFIVMAASLNIGMAWLWLNLETLKDGAGAEFVLGALAITMYLGVPWTLALRLSWEYAERTRRRPFMGPFMESFTMFLVAVPLVTLAILSVMAVTDGQHWIALAGIIVSFLFSNAVAGPFALFLKRLAGLDKERKHTDQADSPHPNT